MSTQPRPGSGSAGRHRKKATPAADVGLRTELEAGDLGRIVSLHGELYAREYGFDRTFEAYVAGPLAEFVRSPSPRSRLWIAEHAGRNAGWLAIVAASARAARLRWYLVKPAMRGRGLGRRLLNEAIEFSRQQGYETVFLRTVSELAAAARQYLAAGFRKTEERPGKLWGRFLIEEKYELKLRQGSGRARPGQNGGERDHAGSDAAVGPRTGRETIRPTGHGTDC